LFFSYSVSIFLPPAFVCRVLNLRYSQKTLCEAFIFARKMNIVTTSRNVAAVHRITEAVFVCAGTEAEESDVHPVMTSQFAERLRCLDCSMCTVCVLRGM